MYTYLDICKQMTDVKFLMFHSNTWNYSSVWKKMSSISFKNVLQIKYLMYMYK